MTAGAGTGDKATGDWDAYWVNARLAAAKKEGGPQDEVLERFWLQLFDKVLPGLRSRALMLDIACGNGAVEGFAAKSVGNRGGESTLRIIGYDRSPSALLEMHKRHPAVSCIAGDSVELPFPAAAFDLVTSQFGVEYGGAEALAEAARVVAPDGVLALVLHLRDGGIYRECAVNRAAIDGFRDSGLLPAFADIFHAARGVQQGRGDRADFQSADRRFSVAVQAAEAVLARHGKQVADGKLFLVYGDVAQMYRGFKKYEPQEVFAWVDIMSGELDSYAGRMASMLQAALDEQQVARLISQLADTGFALRMHDTLGMGPESVPAAWVLVADRRGA